MATTNASLFDRIMSYQARLKNLLSEVIEDQNDYRAAFWDDYQRWNPDCDQEDVLTVLEGDKVYQEYKKIAAIANGAIEALERGRS
jgi:hypothetical protein